MDDRSASGSTCTPTSRRCWSPQEQIAEKIAELAAQIDADYAGREVVLVGVLKGAVMVMADLARALTVPVSLEFMAVSSYGSATSSSGVVRILKDLDRDIAGCDVLVVEDIIDSGLTLSWLLRNLRSRHPALGRGRRDAAQAGGGPGRRCRSPTWASTSRACSSSGTAWTTPSATASCRTSARCAPRSTPS